MITAEQARDISGLTAEQYAKRLSTFIESAANDGDQYVIVRQEPYAGWMYNERVDSKTAKATLEILRKNGFEVSLFYQENQFVDIGLKISWE